MKKLSPCQGTALINDAQITFVLLTSISISLLRTFSQLLIQITYRSTIYFHLLMYNYFLYFKTLCEYVHRWTKCRKYSLPTNLWMMQKFYKENYLQDLFLDIYVQEIFSFRFEFEIFRLFQI